MFLKGTGAAKKKQTAHISNEQHLSGVGCDLLYKWLFLFLLYYQKAFTSILFQSSVRCAPCYAFDDADSVFLYLDVFLSKTGSQPFLVLC